MVDAGEDQILMAETGDDFGIAGQQRVEEFDGDLSPVGEKTGDVDLAHAAAAEA